MKTNIGIFWMLAVFFALATILYVVWGLAVHTNVEWYLAIEWAGAIAMLLTGVLFAFVGFYLTMTQRRLGALLPEDRLDADIDDGDPEIGHFSPWSWWPITLAFALGLVFLGLAVGFWIAFIGVPLVLVALVGWVYEYYRGNFAR